MYKIGHCLYYAELGEIEEEVLHQLPKIGSVAHLIPTSREGRQAQAPAVAQPGPAATATESTGDDGVDEQFVGGVLNLGGDNQTEVDGVREGVDSILNGSPPPMAHYKKEWLVNPYDNMHFLTSLQSNGPPVDAAHPIQEKYVRLYCYGISNTVP